MLLRCPNIVNHPLCASFLFYTQTLTHTHTVTSSELSVNDEGACIRESFILKLLKRLVSRRIAQWTSLLVNMSNASVARPKIIQGYSVMTVTYATPVLSLLKAQWVWGRAGVENCVLYAWVCVLVGGVVMPDWGAEEVLASHAGKVWKFAERRELATPCWAKRMGAERKGRGGENSTMVHRMTSERRGANERGGRGWVGGGGRCPLGEAQRRIQSQVTFSRESSCEHSAPGRRVTVESSVSYTPKPRFSLAAFTLHRSAITKPIKKPRREASAVSQSPLADLATRIIAQESTFQHRI